MRMSPPWTPEASNFVRGRFLFFHWGQNRQSSVVYVLGASYQLVDAAWLVAQNLRDLKGPSLLRLLVFLWGCPLQLLPAFPSFNQPQGSLASVHWLGISICKLDYFLITFSPSIIMLIMHMEVSLQLQIVCYQTVTHYCCKFCLHVSFILSSSFGSVRWLSG